MDNTSNSVEFYEEYGYTHPVEVFSSDELKRFQGQFEELEARVGKEKCTFGLQDYHFEERFIWEMATHAKVLETIQQFIGPDILLYNTRFMCKYPVKDIKGFFAWHQDAAFYGIEPSDAHVAWIALDDSDVENGCLRLIPRSHKNGIVLHGISGRDGNFLRVDQEIPHELIDESTVISAEQKAGTISVHHARTFHASKPNTSNRRRCALIASYISPKIKQDRSYMKQKVSSEYKWKPFTTVVVQGEDHYGSLKKVEPPFPLS